MLKTVDAIHQNIKTIEDCEKQCLDANFRCFSYEFDDQQDPQGKICRTSHLETSSLTHIEEPYLANADAITYERVSCYKGTVIVGDVHLFMNLLGQAFRAPFYEISSLSFQPVLDSWGIIM